MQVSQMSDAITHAVIGSAESVEMGLSDDSAHLMHLFSTALYTYPRLATVREILCNGWDGNITAGNTHIPLQVTITDTLLTIKDFGPGIPHNKIGPIYGTYGNSTKRNDANQTGGFGLGSKAPFAYTDNFEVVSCFEGVKTIYRISKSSMEKGGKPAINKIVSVPTDETGVTVSIVLQQGHREEFTNLVKEVAALGEILVSINDQPVLTMLPISESPTGYLVSSFLGTNTSRINVRYGNVVYPIPMKEEYGPEWHAVNAGMTKLWSHANIIFNCPPDSVSIQPSREALIMTETTMATIKAALSMYKPQELNRARLTVGELHRHAFNVAIKKIPVASVIKDIGSPLYGVSATKFLKMANHWTGPYAFTLRQASLVHTMSRSSPEIDTVDCQIKRIKHLIQNGNLSSIDIKFAKELVKAAKNSAELFDDDYDPHSFPKMATTVFKYRGRQLLDIVRSHKCMSEHSLYLPRYTHRHSAKVNDYPVTQIKVRNTEEGFRFLEKKIVVASTRKAANEWVRYNSREHRLSPWFVYIVPRNSNHIEFIVESFKDKGWTVHRLNLEPREKVEREKSTTVRTPSAKRKGYLSLTDSYDPAIGYTLKSARAVGTAESSVKDPVAWTYLMTENEGATYIPGFKDGLSTIIRSMFGSQIAVVASQTQANALIKKGVPDLKSFIYTYADQKLAESKDFPRYLAFIRPIQKHDGRVKGSKTILCNMLAHPTLMKDLGLRFDISVETKMLVKFFDDTTDDYHSSRDSERAMPLCSALSKKVKRHPLSRILPLQIEDSPYAKFFDLTVIGRHLDYYMPDSSATAIPYELVRKLLK